MQKKCWQFVQAWGKHEPCENNVKMLCVIYRSMYSNSVCVANRIKLNKCRHAEFSFHVCGSCWQILPSLGLVDWISDPVAVVT